MEVVSEISALNSLEFQQLYSDEEFSLVASRSSGQVGLITGLSQLLLPLVLSGMDRIEIIDLISESFKIEPGVAERDLDCFLSQLQSLRNKSPFGLIEHRLFQRRKSEKKPEESFFSTKYYLLSGEVLKVYYPGQKEEDLIHPYFAVCEVEPVDTFRFLQIVREEAPATYRILYNEYELVSCSESKLLHGIIMTNGSVIGIDKDYIVSFHAAAVAMNERAMFLPGRSGQGKSTLTAALVADGFDYLAEDTIFLTGNPLKVLPHRVPIGVKEGSWDPLDKYYPQLKSMPYFERFDRKLVKYIVPPAVSPTAQKPIEVTHILFPQYSAERKQELRELSLSESLERTLSAGYAFQLGTTKEGYMEFVNWARNIPKAELTFNSLDEAVKEVRSWMTRY